MNRIIMSALMITAISVATWGATSAFFSDTETSTGNVLGASAIDLQVSSDATRNGTEVPSQSWAFKNLDSAEKFWNYTDLAPGHYGENTIGVKVEGTDAYACLAVTNLANNENEVVEPELEAGDDSSESGELADQVNILLWTDNGDNLLGAGEEVLFNGTAAAFAATEHYTLVDSTEDNINSGGVMTANTAYYVGQAWCHGTISETPGTGVGYTCDGSTATAASMTDQLTADFEFVAVQSENNTDFTCADLIGEPTQ